MVLNKMMTRLQACLAFAALCPTLSIVRSIEAQTARKDAGDITERIVQVQTKDDVTDSGSQAIGGDLDSRSDPQLL
jgi:hypothetical protein